MNIYNVNLDNNLAIGEFCLWFYELCLSHYLRAPAFSWDAMLNMTKVKLERISDGDMSLFFKKGKTGTVSYIFKRHSKVNSMYLKSFDKTKIYYIHNFVKFIWLYFV